MTTMCNIWLKDISRCAWDDHARAVELLAAEITDNVCCIHFYEQPGKQDICCKPQPAMNAVRITGRQSERLFICSHPERVRDYPRHSGGERLPRRETNLQEGWPFQVLERTSCGKLCWDSKGCQEVSSYSRSRGDQWAHVLRIRWRNNFTTRKYEACRCVTACLPIWQFLTLQFWTNWQYFRILYPSGLKIQILVFDILFDSTAPFDSNSIGV